MNIAVPDTIRAASPFLHRPIVRIVIVGHVDHGKSTLIGRLLHETGSLPDGKVEALKAVSARRGMPFEWSFLLDALQTERDQGITIDTSQIRFRTPSRDFVLIDAPGHTEFLRNMITGAAQADAAILIVDAVEGVREQTRRHGYLLHLLGVTQVAVVINKMDRIAFDPARFEEIRAEIAAYLSGLGVTPHSVIPISARRGDGVAGRTADISWYDGPIVTEALDGFHPAPSAQDTVLRMPIQAIYKFDDRRIVAGRVESGAISVGEEVTIMPGAKTAVVRSIEAWPVPARDHSPASASAGQSIGITFDRELFLERGGVIAPAAAPIGATETIKARIFWLHPTPLIVGTPLLVRIGTAEARGTVVAIVNAVDPGQLSVAQVSSIAQNHVGEVEFALSQPLAADPYAKNSHTGRAVVEIAGRIAGGGLVLSLRADKKEIASPRIAPRHASDAPALAAKAAELAPLMSPLSAAERLGLLRKQVAGKLVFTTSFGIEDQVILHLIAENGLDIEPVTLDTGRLFPETYALWEKTEQHFGRRVRAVYPRHDDLEALVARQGINGFFHSREARLSCCHVRKIEPLNRALAGATGWIAGLRGGQSANRQQMDVVSVDRDRNLIKLNPLFDWTREATAFFAVDNGVPLNPLHERGYLSIGCAPCTRALRPGEDERAGRWWWEDETQKECGLHRPG